MLIVNQGVEGPRAVALQILLNRFGAAGTPLQVDGHYGPNTAKAVAAFRKDILKAPGVGSTTDVVFWNRLLQMASLQTIETVDVTDPMLTETAVPALNKLHANQIELGGTSNGVAQLMTLVAGQARYSGSVLLMRTHSHGGPGVVAISHGTRKLSPGIDPNRELTVLNEKTIVALQSSLSLISDIFADFGFVEFHACKVAQGPKMIQALADIWKVPITAPLTSQKATDVSVLSGPVRTFYPGGVSLRQWAESRSEARCPQRQASGSPYFLPSNAYGMSSMDGGMSVAPGN